MIIMYSGLMYCRPNSKPYNDRPNIFRPIWLKLQDTPRTSKTLKDSQKSSKIFKNLIRLCQEMRERVKSKNMCFIMMEVQQRSPKIFTDPHISTKIL